MSKFGQLKNPIKAAPLRDESIARRVLAYIQGHSPCSFAEMADSLAMTKHCITTACAYLKKRNEVHRTPKRMWVYGPEPRAEAPKVERYIPPNMDHSSVKHWTADVPAERLVAFKLPSLVNGKPVYPKEPS
jgi:hypothetical protein